MMSIEEIYAEIVKQTDAMYDGQSIQSAVKRLAFAVLKECSVWHGLDNAAAVKQLDERIEALP